MFDCTRDPKCFFKHVDFNELLNTHPKINLFGDSIKCLYCDRLAICANEIQDCDVDLCIDHIPNISQVFELEEQLEHLFEKNNLLDLYKEYVYEYSFIIICDHLYRDIPITIQTIIKNYCSI